MTVDVKKGNFNKPIVLGLLTFKFKSLSGSIVHRFWVF